MKLIGFKRYSTPLVMGETNMKTTKRYYYDGKDTDLKMQVRIWDLWSLPHTVLFGM